MKNVILLSDEVWVPVVGYEKQYLVSNYSRVYSIGYKRLVVPCKIDKNSRYMRIGLSNRTSRLMQGIHRISAIAFIPNPGNLPEVNHKDGDRENNHISNFEWTTHRENVNHGAITKNKTSWLIGVTYNCNKKRWRARIYVNKKEVLIGTYDTEVEANEAYIKYCVDLGISIRYVA